MSDAIAELCALLRESGLTLRFYGQPIGEDALRDQVGRRAVAPSMRVRVRLCGPRVQPQHRRGPRVHFAKSRRQHRRGPRVHFAKSRRQHRRGPRVHFAKSRR